MSEDTKAIVASNLTSTYFGFAGEMVQSHRPEQKSDQATKTAREANFREVLSIYREFLKELDKAQR